MCEVSIHWKQKFFEDVDEIKLKEPLAEFLGAIEEGECFVFTYSDCVKFAGHSCPTVATAYKITQKALRLLYGKEIPERGGMRVKVSGKPGEGVNGIMAQIISFVTGACPETGFQGLGGKFVRKNKLVFEEEEKPNTFVFIRHDNSKSVRITYHPELIPENERLFSLLKKSLFDVATDEEKEEFENLWQERVRMILFDEIPSLLEIEELYRDL